MYVKCIVSLNSNEINIPLIMISLTSQYYCQTNFPVCLAIGCEILTNHMDNSNPSCIKTMVSIISVGNVSSTQIVVFLCHFVNRNNYLCL